TRRIADAAFSPDRRHLALSTGPTHNPDGSMPFPPLPPDEVKVYDAVTGRELVTFRPGGPVTLPSFSPDGRRLAVRTARRTGVSEMRVWDLATGLQTLALDVPWPPNPAADGEAGPLPLWGLCGRCRLAAFSSDGTRLVTSGGPDGWA